MTTCWQLAIWGGRALLVSAPVAVIGCRFTRHIWGNAPLDSGGSPSHWIPAAVFLLSFMWALLLPFLVLPIAPLPLVFSSRTTIFGETVLGVRSVVRGNYRLIHTWAFLGRGSCSYAYVIRDSEKNWFIAWDGGDGRVGPAALLPAIDRARSRRVPLRVWAHGVLAVCVWGLCTFVILGLCFYAAGVVG